MEEVLDGGGLTARPVMGIVNSARVPREMVGEVMRHAQSEETGTRPGKCPSENAWSLRGSSSSRYIDNL